MKNKKYILLFILIIIGIFTYSLLIPKTPKTSTPVTTEIIKDFRIALVSDIHITSKNPKDATAKDDVNLDIMDALKADLLNENINFLVLCGDNTNSSQPWQNEALKKKLYEITKTGIEVIMIPGNHDIGSLKVEDFENFYQDFGYKNAYSRDNDSLSYSYLKGNHLILMLDTDGYTDHRNAELSHATLDWIKQQLKVAKTNQWKVLTVGHYPLVTAHATGFTGKKDAISLFKKYEMPLYICGHLHNRNVNTNDNLVELVVDKLTSYPCNYAIVEIKEDEIIYTPKRIDLFAYNLTSFATYGELARAEMGTSVVEALCTDYPDTSNEDRELAADYFVKLMTYLSDGSIYHHIDELKNHEGSPIFERIAEKSNYGPWLPSLFNNANPYTEGFRIKNGELQAMAPVKNSDSSK